MQWITVLQACVPILVALVPIIPTIINNRKKTQESIDKLQKTLENHIREDEDEKARNQRARILRFYDEICEGRLHSESHYEDVLDDITDYETYCARHPDFRNSYAVSAIKHIRDTYQNLLEKHEFKH